MKDNPKFLIVKDNKTKEIRYFDYEKIDGYNLKAKENAHFEDAIDISRMIIVKPSFIEKIATKKLDAKFDRIITMMSVVCEDDDSTEEGYYIVLNELTKLRLELLNKYRKYIEKEKLELMNKKIEILEDELKLRLQFINKKEEIKEIDKGHSR